MDQNPLTFELKNSFAQFLWSPDQDATAEQAKTPNGLYTVGVLYSLERSLRSQNANAAVLAQALHDLIAANLDELEQEFSTRRDAVKSALADDILQLPEFSRPKPIVIEADKVRQLTVKFIRCFLVYDQTMHAIHEQFRHAMITKSGLMKLKKEVSAPLRRFMAETSKQVRLYHERRRQLIAEATTETPSAVEAPAAISASLQ